MSNPMQKASLQERLNGMLVEDHDKGEYRVHRSAFTDEELFELYLSRVRDDDDGGESEEAAVAGADPVRVYETDYVRPSHRPVSGRLRIRQC